MPVFYTTQLIPRAAGATAQQLYAWAKKITAWFEKWVSTHIDYSTSVSFLSPNFSLSTRATSTDAFGGTLYGMIWHDGNPDNKDRVYECVIGNGYTSSGILFTPLNRGIYANTSAYARIACTFGASTTSALAQFAKTPLQTWSRTVKVFAPAGLFTSVTIGKTVF